MIKTNLKQGEAYAARHSAYLNDSDEALLIHIVFDLSTSVRQIGAFPIYNGLTPSLKKTIEENPEARAKVKVAVTCYGEEVEEVSGFVPIYELNEDDICHDMGTTDSAKALDFAFESTRREIEKAQTQGKRILRSIVFHVTDGLPTSTNEEMTEVIEKYNAYTSGNGKRRIQIIAATPSKEAAKRLVYSDQTLLTEDYKGICDAINFIASTASALSSLTPTTNPKTGETFVDLSEAKELIKVGGGITEVIPMEKTMSLEDILG